MKTSVILIVAIFINTSLLLSQPILVLAEKINSWVLIAIELTLLFVWFAVKTVRELRNDLEIDLNDLEVFVISGKKKVSTKNK
ncbi:hypothetical protein [Flagellimonas sp.]|uniref:hypothetical protein n=1 Tax=Flagellimonas sp. TaxID=2058762 RepID=UPI003F4A3AFD